MSRRRGLLPLTSAPSFATATPPPTLCHFGTGPNGARGSTTKIHMEKPKKTVTNKTREFAKAFPPHPRQADFLASATKWLADDVAGTATAEHPLTKEDA